MSSKQKYVKMLNSQAAHGIRLGSNSQQMPKHNNAAAEVLIGWNDRKVYSSSIVPKKTQLITENFRSSQAVSGTEAFLSLSCSL